MQSNSLGKESVIGRIPQNIPKFSWMFLVDVPITLIEVEVVGKRLNLVGGYGLEIPVKYHFYGQEKIVKWLTKKLKLVKKS